MWLQREVCGWKIAVGVVIEIVSLLFTFLFYAVKEDHLYSYDSWQRTMICRPIMLIHLHLLE
ncbi:MAG: hypothetical protein ACLS9K_07620 [Lachnospira eligens]